MKKKGEDEAGITASVAAKRLRAILLELGELAHEDKIVSSCAPDPPNFSKIREIYFIPPEPSPLE